MYPQILIVDDEPSILNSLRGLLSDEGFEILTANNGYEALKIIENESPDLVLLDIWMPGLDGIETLIEIKKENKFIQVIIITGHGTIETAVKSTKLGAYDFIEKPLSIERVIVAINNALNFRKLAEENRYLRKKTIEKNSINGNSLPVRELQKQIQIAAPTDAWILIKGENGTGKELVARTIHQLSSRSEYPLVSVNCAAITDELIESELLGHEKGAFTGATAKKRGKFELADKGTLFLDEIGDMSMKTQGKILRVLQEQKFHRLGGSRTLKVNVRIIVSTNKDLEEEIKKKKFREDLYFRLNVIPIDVPPLRERIEDIPLLVNIFFDECVKKDHIKKKIISDEALKILCAYPWPGNVRELKNLIERLAIMAKGEIVGVSDIPYQYNRENIDIEKTNETKLFSLKYLMEAKKAFEVDFVKKKLTQYKDNVAKTAEAIGVDSNYLNKLLGQHDKK